MCVRFGNSLNGLKLRQGDGEDDMTRMYTEQIKPLKIFSNPPAYDILSLPVPPKVPVPGPDNPDISPALRLLPPAPAPVRIPDVFPCWDIPSQFLPFVSQRSDNIEIPGKQPRSVPLNASPRAMWVHPENNRFRFVPK